MSEPKMETHENRRWKIIGTTAIALLGLVLIIWATGEGAADEVRAKRFVLVDSNGNERATLSEESGGEVSLVFMDKGGKVRAGLGVGADGLPELTLYDANQKKLVRLRTHSRGGSHLELYATDIKGHAFIGMVGDGPFVDLVEKDGISLSLYGHGLGLLDKKYKAFVALGPKPNGQPALTFIDKKGKVIWSAP